MRDVREVVGITLYSERVDRRGHDEGMSGEGVVRREVYIGRM